VASKPLRFRIVPAPAPLPKGIPKGAPKVKPHLTLVPPPTVPTVPPATLRTGESPPPPKCDTGSDRDNLVDEIRKLVDATNQVAILVGEPIIVGLDFAPSATIEALQADRLRLEETLESLNERLARQNARRRAPAVHGSPWFIRPPRRRFTDRREPVDSRNPPTVYMAAAE